MERIVGPSMLDNQARRPWMLFRSAQQFAEAHATMHTCQRPELLLHSRLLSSGH